jgi:hypothetical protein
MRRLLIGFALAIAALLSGAPDGKAQVWPGGGGGPIPTVCPSGYAVIGYPNFGSPLTCGIVSGGGTIGGPGSTTVGYVPQWGNTSGTLLTAGLPVTTTQPGVGSLIETNGSNLLDPSLLPTPTSSTLGGLESITCATSKWINVLSTGGVPSCTQPAFTDLQGSIQLSQFPQIANNTALCNVSGGLAVPTACTTTQVTTLINNFTTTLSGAAPPSGGGSTNFLRADGTWAAPAGTTYTASGGITLTSGNFTLTTIAATSVLANTTGGTAGPTSALCYGLSSANCLLQVGSGGTIANAVIPNPGSSVLGGIESISCATHTWLNVISAFGVPSCAQPAFTDLSGQIATSQLPTLTANQYLGTIASGTPAGITIPSCSGSQQALNYTTGTGLGCVTIASQTVTTWLTPPAAAATITVLPFTPTYNNGTAGVGATLTATSFGALVVDGYTVLLNDTILVNNQAAPAQNGVYTETTLGDGSHDYVLTRRTDNNSASNIAAGQAIAVQNGGTQTGFAFVQTTVTPPTVGTTAITWASLGPIVTQYTAANPLTLTGTTFGFHSIGATTVPANVTGGSAAPTGSIAYATTTANNVLVESTGAGVIDHSFIPQPTASLLGGIESLTCAASNWLNVISTAGVPGCAQPAFSDITGQVTLGQLPSIGNNTVLGNVSGGTATPTALTATQLTTLCNTFTAGLKGCVAASGGGTANFLRADGTWVAPPGTTYTAVSPITLTSTAFGFQAIPTLSVPANVTGGSATPSGNIGYVTVATVSSLVETGAGGTIDNSFLPGPTPSQLGGVESITCGTHLVMYQIHSGTGVPACEQLGFSDLTGQATLSQLPSIGSNTVLGNVTGGSAVPTALTTTQLTTLCNVFSSTLKGCVAASGGGTNNFLRADGAWVPGTVISMQVCTALAAGTYTLAYTASTECASGSDANGIIPVTGGGTITINQSSSTYFPAGSTVAIGVPPGDASATIALGTGATWSSNSVAPIVASTITVAANTAVQIFASASGDYFAVLTSGPGAPCTGCALLGSPNTFTAQNTFTTSRVSTVGVDVTTGPLTQSVPNGSNSTTTNKLMIYQSGGGYTFQTALVSSTTNVTGICLSSCTNTGNAIMAVGGTAQCVFDGATTAADWVVASTTVAGDCHDAGATVPTAVQVLGQVNSTNGGAGTYGVDLNPVGVASASANCPNCALLNVAQSWTAAQRGAQNTITISTSTFTPNFNTTQHPVFTLVHASCPCTLANPSTTPVAGQTGIFEVIQSSTGSDTIGTWGSDYITAGGTAGLTLSTAANAKDFMGYYVVDSTHILLYPPTLNAAH